MPLHYSPLSNRTGQSLRTQQNVLHNITGTSGGSARATTLTNARLVAGQETDVRNRSIASSFVFGENVVGNLSAGA